MLRMREEGYLRLSLVLGIPSLLITGDCGNYGSDGDQDPVGWDLKHVSWSPCGSSLGDWRGDYDSPASVGRRSSLSAGC